MLIRPRIRFIPFLIFVLSNIIFVKCISEKKERVASPKAEKGILNLENWDFKENGSVSLDGEWEFYWKQLVEPRQIDIDSDAPENEIVEANNAKSIDRKTPYIIVPGNWTSFKTNEISASEQGYATYRVTLRLKSNEKLALKLPPIGTAAKVFANGLRVAEIGKIGKSWEEVLPSYDSQVVAIPTDRQLVEILIHVSNFDYNKGGIWSSIKIGIPDTLQKEREKNLQLNFFLFGALLLMGIYHLGLYALQKKDKSTLYFGLFSILISIRPFIAGEYYLFSIFSWIIALRIEYLTMYLGVPLFLFFMASIFPEKSPTRMKFGVAALSIPLSLCVIFLPSFYFSQTLIVMQLIVLFAIAVVIYILTSAILRKKTGAKSFLSAFVIFAAIITNDILHDLEVIHTDHYTPYGFLIFIFSQAFFLSVRSSQAYNQIEKFAEILELKIIERTKELEIAKRKTEELSHLIKHLNETIGLQNIMSIISEYVKNKYKFDYHSLYILEAPAGEMKFAHANLPSALSDEARSSIEKSSFRLEASLAEDIYLKAFTKETPIFISIIDSKIRFKDKLLGLVDYQSILVVPIFLHNVPMGMLVFFSVMPNTLQNDDIAEFAILSEHLAGVIQNSHLLNQVQTEKEKALIAQSESEKQKEQTESLNQLVKSLNEKLDMNIIMKKVRKYVMENFNLNDYGLFSVNAEKTHIKLLDMTFPDSVESLDRQKMYDMQIPIQGKKGAHAFVFKTNKPFYAPTVQMKRIWDSVTDEELFVIQKNNIQSFLIVPLILDNEPIAILDFSNYLEKIKLSREDILRISILCEQLAGIIHGSNLFKQVQIEKEKNELERHKSEKLLLNILPKEIAEELKEKGTAEPEHYDSVSVLFTDFKGFTQIAESLSPKELVKDLDGCFVQFDKIMDKYGLEKLKTIGDSYMAAGGIPKKNSTHAIDCVLAALEIQDFMNLMKMLKEEAGSPYWELRLGIHSGPVIAGVIGEKKFAYDVWGDTVNTASRMESSGTTGKINISGATYELIQEFFECEYRGEVDAKHKGLIQMYYVLGLKKEYSVNEDGRVPNEKFLKLYKEANNYSFAT